MVRIIGIGALVLIVLCNSLASHAIAKQKGLVQKRSSQPALELAQMILMLPVQLEFLAIHPHFIDCKGVVNEEDRAQLTQKMEALSKQIHHPMVLTIKTISDTEKSFEWQGSWK